MRLVGHARSDERVSSAAPTADHPSSTFSLALIPVSSCRGSGQEHTPRGDS